SGPALRSPLPPWRPLAHEPAVGSRPRHDIGRFADGFLDPGIRRGLLRSTALIPPEASIAAIVPSRPAIPTSIAEATAPPVAKARTTSVAETAAFLAWRWGGRSWPRLPPGPRA